MKKLIIILLLSIQFLMSFDDSRGLIGFHFTGTDQNEILAGVHMQYSLKPISALDSLMIGLSLGLTKYTLFSKVDAKTLNDLQIKLEYEILEDTIISFGYGGMIVTYPSSTTNLDLGSVALTYFLSEIHPNLPSSITVEYRQNVSPSSYPLSTASIYLDYLF